MEESEREEVGKAVLQEFAEIHSAIGSVCSSFAMLENELITAIGCLLDLSRKKEGRS